MIIIFIIMIIMIILLFILSYIGFYSINTEKKNPSGSLELNTTLPYKSIKCADTKVKCSDNSTCNTVCNDTTKMKCITITEPEIKKYFYMIPKNDVKITFNKETNTNVKDLTEIQIPYTSINSYETLKNSDQNTIYINFKYSAKDLDTDILNRNYGNFIAYNKNNVFLQNNIITINVSYKESNVTYDIDETDSTDISITWYTVNNQKQQGYCLPSTLENPPKCNSDTGGMLTFTGWTVPDTTNWTCLCRYPNFFSGSACDILNPNVCSGGKFTYDSKNQAPVEGTCICDNDKKVVVKDYRGVPYCVDRDLEKWYTTYFNTSGDIIQDMKIN